MARFALSASRADTATSSSPSMPLSKARPTTRPIVPNPAIATLMRPGPVLGSCLIDDRGAQLAEPGDLDLDHVAGLHEFLGAVIDAAAGAGGDHVAGTEPADHREIRD